MLTKETFIFLTAIILSFLILFKFSVTGIILIFFSLIYLYLSLNRKNKNIGLPALVATFTVLFVLYLAGLVGDCHVCSADKDGTIFYCNRLINLSPSDYDKQLGNNQCKKELIWVWP